MIRDQLYKYKKNTTFLLLISLIVLAFVHQIHPRRVLGKNLFKMSAKIITVSYIILLFLKCSAVLSFPDGAPGSTCAKHRPNHGAKAQPLSTLPFIVKASASEYKQGETIAVRITGKPGVYFKGFFVQAHDETGKWIGTFESTPFSVSHPECSMITHSENEEKEEVTLIWHPPKDSESGTVHFIASVLKSYKQYWVDAPASAPSPKNVRRR